MSIRIKLHAPKVDGNSRVLQFARNPNAPLAPAALPAHELAARQRRAEILAFPSAASLRPPRQPKPALGARKTFDIRVLSSKFGTDFV